MTGVRRRVGAVPARVAPGQIPPRLLRQRVGHEIEPTRAPRLAAQQPREGHPAARPKAIAVDRLVGIVRAGRQVPAIETNKRRERVAIDFDQAPAGEARGTAAEVGGGRQFIPPRSSRRSCRRAWPRSGRWRRPRRRRSAASRHGAPCSRAPARAPRYRPICRHAAARRFP